MSDEISPEQRLWAVNTKGSRDGVPLWPLAIILTIGAVVIGLLMLPCMGLRLDYLRYGDGQMNVLQMECGKEGSECVCRQDAKAVRGGQSCVVRADLKVRCRPAEGGL